MALLWFVIGLVVGIGVCVFGLALFTYGLQAGEKKAKQDGPITTDAEVK